MMEYLKETHMLDYSHPTIQKLIHDKHWKEMNEFKRIQSIYLITHNQQVNPIIEIIFMHKSQEN